ncbi:hypothetical protein CsatB_009912 [Cannabis sativa]|uniref:uncharacterized protein LOC115705094 n=1 Tax=Cannabis sativa TaxID=3483 RepID=UPI0029CA6B02|nr:uncharacterized protein LOC115705094 [Cannabis sativa]
MLDRWFESQRNPNFLLLSIALFDIHLLLIALFDIHRSLQFLVITINLKLCSACSVEVDSSSGDSDNNKVVGSRKRQRSESSGGASCSNYKACREKLRRDRLNERFLKLVAVIETDYWYIKRAYCDA